MNRLLASTIGCLACVAVASVADAQMVRVGPYGGVSIRAPFVSVDTLPFGGGTRVRAPFTSVNTRAFAYGYGYGGYGYPYRYDYYAPYRPVYPVPVYAPPIYPDVVYPTPSAQFPRTPAYRAARPSISMDNSVAASAATPDRLRASALQLKRSLSVRRDDGDVWLDYLAPDRIVETIDSGAAPGSLSDLLLNYEGVVGNPSLSAIRSANGFNETHRLLRGFVSSPTPASPTPASPLDDSTSTPKATTTGDGNSILAPTPVPEPGLDGDQPTPATPVKPAGDGEEHEAQQEKEELPLPPPEPTPL